MSAIQVPGRGVLVTVQGSRAGLSILLPATMSLAAIERYLAELREFVA